MTYVYAIRYLRNLRPANLLRTQRIHFSMLPQHVHMTRDPTVVRCLLSREPLRIIIIIIISFATYSVYIGCYDIVLFPSHIQARIRNNALALYTKSCDDRG